jgi:opacity protein-like surface antigen
MLFTELKHPEKDYLCLETEALHSKSLLRVVLFIFLLSFVCPESWSQRNADIGIFAGGSYYMGDLNPYRHMYKPLPAAGGIYRYNFNPRNSLRFHAVYGELRGGDSLDFTNNFQQNHAAENFRTPYLDLAINTEFNFFPYQYGLRKDRFTPYVTAGLGYNFVFSSEKRGTTGLIFTYGAGFKGNVSKRISAGFEWSFRKTFNDRLDGVENPHSPEGNALSYHNSDWYSIVGIFVTYKFLSYLYECPAYE